MPRRVKCRTHAQVRQNANSLLGLETLMPEVKRKPNKAIVDFVDFKVTEIYGNKPLAGSDSVFLDLVKCALLRDAPASSLENTESATKRPRAKKKG